MVSRSFPLEIPNAMSAMRRTSWFWVPKLFPKAAIAACYVPLLKGGLTCLNFTKLLSVGCKDCVSISGASNPAQSTLLSLPTHKAMGFLGERS